MRKWLFLLEDQAETVEDIDRRLGEIVDVVPKGHPDSLMEEMAEMLRANPDLPAQCIFVIDIMLQRVSEFRDESGKKIEVEASSAGLSFVKAVLRQPSSRWLHTPVLLYTQRWTGDGQIPDIVEEINSASSGESVQLFSKNTTTSRREFVSTIRRLVQ